MLPKHLIAHDLRAIPAVNPHPESFLKELLVKEREVLEQAFAMPLTSPAYPRGPYRFINREFFIITYETDPEALERVIPAPLEMVEPVVQYEFIRMPDSTGFGDYCESGQAIPVSFRGRRGGYSHAMYLDDNAPLVGGRELWGFPKKLGRPSLEVRKDTLVGTLDYNGTRVATGTMGYKHQSLPSGDILESLRAPHYLLRIIPDVDGSARICELVEYHMEDINLKGVWGGPGALELTAHALAPVSELPVKRVRSAVHVMTDLTLALGKVVHDDLR
jgi:acetoacetate decarboxylase